MPMYSFTTIDNPAGAGTTNPRDINNAGQIVGSYRDNTGNHGFLFQNGVFTPIDDPLAAANTTANGINQSGQIVGSYVDANNATHAFLFKDGMFFTIDDPLATKGTVALDINTAGQIVGFYTADDGVHGFIRSITGAFTTFDAPAGSPLNGGTQPQSINDEGQIVGNLTDAAGMEFGFVFSNGTFLGVAFTTSFAEGINNGGQVTGSYLTDNKFHGFLYDAGFPISNGGSFTTLDDPQATGPSGFTFPNGINDAGRIVGVYTVSGTTGQHGFLATVVPNAPPPAGTTAVMILRGADTSAVKGQYQIYDLGNNAILASFQLGFVGTDWKFAGLGSFVGGDIHDILLSHASTNGLGPQLEVYDVTKNNITAAANLGAIANDLQPIGFGKFSTIGETDMIARDVMTGALVVYNIRNNQIINGEPLGQVGLPWQFSGVGNFNGHGNSDMLLRDSNAGGLQIYNIANNKIIGTAFLGTIGLDWQFSGVGDFIGVPGEGDLLLRNVNTGGLQVYNIANNQLKGTAFLGTIGLDWQFAGVAQVNTAGASDLILRNVNTGAFQVYNIANNQITASASLGIVGLEWQLGGFAADQPPATAAASDGSTSQLVQAMAGFGGGAADTSATAPLSADTSQQTFLTTPHA